MSKEIDYQELIRMLAIKSAEDMTVEDIAETLFNEYFKQKPKKYLLKRFIKEFGEHQIPKKKII